jgi:hypothetical protein
MRVTKENNNERNIRSLIIEKFSVGMSLTVEFATVRFRWMNELKFQCYNQYL